MPADNVRDYLCECKAYIIRIRTMIRECNAYNEGLSLDGERHKHTMGDTETNEEINLNKESQIGAILA